MKIITLCLAVLALFALASYPAVAQGINDLKSNLERLNLGYNEEVLDWLVNSDHEGPFHVVNLLKFRK